MRKAISPTAITACSGARQRINVAQRSVQIDHRRRRQRPERPRAHHPKLGPSPQEGRQPPISLAQVHVGSARLGRHGRQFRQRQRAAQRDQSQDDPDRDDRPEGVQLRGHDRRLEKYARTDDRPHDNGHGVEQAEHARQLGLGFFGLKRHDAGFSVRDATWREVRMMEDYGAWSLTLLARICRPSGGGYNSRRHTLPRRPSLGWGL